MFPDQEDQQHEYVAPPLETYKLNLQPQQQIRCDLLYVAFYGVSSLYVSALVSTQNPIAKINFQKAKQRSLASVYFNQDKSSAFIIFNQQFQKMKEIHFAEFIQKYFTFKSLYVFTSIPKGMLQKDDGKTLKYLQTSWGLDLHGPRFDQGITGPQADLLQWAQIRGMNAVCFIGIFSDYQLNKQVVDGIFSNVQNMLQVQNKFDTSKLIKSYNTAKFSNKLYL